MNCENCKNYEYCSFYGTECYESEEEMLMYHQYAVATGERLEEVESELRKRGYKI